MTFSFCQTKNCRIGVQNFCINFFFLEFSDLVLDATDWNTKVILFPICIQYTYKLLVIFHFSKMNILILIQVFPGKIVKS